MSFPECSITGVKPTITSISSNEIELETKKRVKSINFKEWRRCCICGNIPTKTAKYKLESAVRIEKYCNDCVRRRFDPIR